MDWTNKVKLAQMSVERSNKVGLISQTIFKISVSVQISIYKFVKILTD